MRTVLLRGQTIPLGGDLSGDFKGYTYTCPACGEQWAKLVLGKAGHFIQLSLPCEQHGGGSILKPLIWWEYLTLGKTLDSLERPVLVYECLIAIERILI